MAKRLAAANTAENVVRTAALCLVPLALVWKTFRSYTWAALMPSFGEGWLTFVGRITGLTLMIVWLPNITTFAFGISNLLFEGIAGSPANFSAVAAKLSAGASQLSDSVHSPGIMIVVCTLCIVMALVWIALGLVFLLRTIEVYIMFALGPLALVGGMTDEFAGWFRRWLAAMQGLLIAPLPVAVCFRLITTFGNFDTLSQGPATDKLSNFAAYILQLIYIIAFLGIGTFLMFKIAGEVGQTTLGLALDTVKAKMMYGGKSGKGSGAKGALSDGAGDTSAGKEGDTTNGSRSSTPSGSAPGGNGSGGSNPTSGNVPSGGSAGAAGSGATAPAQATQSDQFSRDIRGFREAINLVVGNSTSSPSRVASNPPAESSASPDIPAANFSNQWHPNAPQDQVFVSESGNRLMPSHYTADTKRLNTPLAPAESPSTKRKLIKGAVVDPFDTDEKLNDAEDRR